MLRAKNIEDRIFDITNSATKTTLNAKINEVKNKIASISMYINFCFGFLDQHSYRNYEFCNRIKICAITAKSKKYKSTAKKKKKKHDKIVASITNLAAITTAFNAKTNEFKNKITNIANLATTTALTAIGEKNLILVIQPKKN